MKRLTKIYNNTEQHNKNLNSIKHKLFVGIFTKHQDFNLKHTLNCNENYTFNKLYVKHNIFV